MTAAMVNRCKVNYLLDHSAIVGNSDHHCPRRLMVLNDDQRSRFLTSIDKTKLVLRQIQIGRK